MGVFLTVHSTKDNISRYFKPANLEKYHQALNIEYNHATIKQSKNGLFAFIHYERDNALYSSKEQTYFSIENNQLSITLLQGYLWNKQEGKNIVIAQKLQHLLKNNNSEAIRDKHNGEYSILHYNEEENKLSVFNDRMGVESLYYYKDKNNIIISNRIRLIRELLKKSEPDFETLHWITAVGIIIGEGTSEKSIKRLPQGAFLTIKNNKMLIHKDDIFMIDQQFNNSLHSKSFFPFFNTKRTSLSISKIIDTEIEKCATTIDICLKHVPNLHIPMSGGKDSRAVFALLHYFSQRNHIKLFTNGFDQHADVIVAKQISEHFNLDLQINNPTPPINVDDNWVFNKIKGHVFQTDGMLGAWDAKGYSACAGGLSLTGHIGEVYRSNYNKSGKADLSSIKTAAHIFHSLNLFDRAEFLTQSARQYYEQKLEERLSFYLDNGASLRDTPDLLYAVERVPNWVATLRRTDGYSQCLINPLNTETLIKLAYYLGDEQRKMERIHFEIINRSNPWLASQAFADDCWDKDLNQYANGTKLAKNKIITKKHIPVFGSWQYKLRDSASLRDKFLDVFMSYPQSPTWDYCDKKIVEEKFKKGLFPSTFELLSAYGFINAFFYAHKIELPIKINKPLS